MMLSFTMIRQIIPSLAFIFSQILQIKTENDFDYSLESPALLTTSEIAEEIMNQNLNLNCASLKEFFNSETYQDVEKILNMTSNSTEVIENREEYHSRIKRCTEIERQNRISRKFDRRNRIKERIGNYKPGRGCSRQKHPKNGNSYETTSYESPKNDDAKEDADEGSSLRRNLTRSMYDSASTNSYLRTYRTVSGNPPQSTTNSAPLEISTKDNQEKQCSGIDTEKATNILKENRNRIKNSTTILYPIPYTKSTHQRKNESGMRSTKALENGGKKRKGPLFSLLGNIRNVMEGGPLKNISESSKFDSARESSSTENVTNEESLAEYETVTPHQFTNFHDLDKFRNEHEIKGISSSTTTENFQITREMRDETKKQLQSKFEELIRIRKKLLEIVRIADSTKNQTKLLSGAPDRNSTKNRKKVKEETTEEIFSLENSENNLNQKKCQSNKTPNVKNKIDPESSFLGRQSTSSPSSIILTSVPPQKLKDFTKEDPFITKTSTKNPHTGDKVIGGSSPTISIIEDFPTQSEANVSKKINPFVTGISEKKNPEIFLGERAQLETGIDRTKSTNHLENVPSHSVLESTLRPRKIIKDKKISTHHSTTPQNFYIEPNFVRQTSPEITQTSNHASHLSQISSISHHQVAKNPTHSQTLHLRENEPEVPFQTTPTLKLPHLNKITSPQLDVTSSKELVSKEDSHSIASITPHTFPKEQNLLSERTFTSESPNSKKETISHPFHHHKTPKVTITLKNIHSSDIPTTQSTRHSAEENSAVTERSHSTSSTTQTTHLPKAFSKSHEAFPKLKLSLPETHKSTLSPSGTSKSTISSSEAPKSTLSPPKIPNIRKIEIFDPLHLHKTSSEESSPLENAHSVNEFAPQSLNHLVQKTSTLEHSLFGIIPTIPSPHAKEKDSKLISNTPKFSDQKKIISQHEKCLTENSASFNHHSTKTITIQPLFESETTFKDRISTKEYHPKENSISGPLNKAESLPDLITGARQSISKESLKSPYHTTTLNPIIVSILEKLEKLRKNVTPHKPNLGKISSLEPVHSHEYIFSKTTSPQNPHSLHTHSQEPDLSKISHQGHQHLQPSHLEKISTTRPSNIFEVSGVTLPMISHSENQIIPQPAHRRKESLFEKISTSKPSHSTATFFKGTTLPQKSHMESQSIPQPVHNHFTPKSPHSHEISTKETILPQKFHKESQLISQTVHPQHHHPELTYFEKTTTHQPTHSTKTFSNGIPQKFHKESSSTSYSQFNHLNGISTPLPEVPPKRTVSHQTFHQNHPTSETGRHLHLDNLKKIISHSHAQSTEPSSKATISPLIFHRDKSSKTLPESKLSHFATEVTIAHPEHLRQKPFSKPTTKLPELHLEEKSTYSTPFPIHSTTQIKTLHHPTNDNATWLILEAIKRLEKEKIEEIRKLHCHLQDLQKTRLTNLPHTTLPYSETSSKESPNKSHGTDGKFSHTPKTLKHEAQDRSGTGQDIKRPTHDVTKPYPVSPTTYAMLESDLELVEKPVKPLPPLNPNDNWKYIEKLDKYYQNQQQSTTPQPRKTRPPTIPTPKPRVTPIPLITPSPTMVPPTVAPRVPGPLRNATKGLNQRSTSTQKPSPVNYNINSTINRNYNITVNFVPPDSPPRENNEDEKQPEDNQPITDDESDPFTALARSTEASKKSNENSVGDFDSPSHPSLLRQSSQELSNSSNFSSLNETIQQPNSSTISNGIPNNEPVSFVQIKITPSDDSLPISYNFENKDTILQSPTPFVTKSPDSSITATTPYQQIIKNLQSLTLKVQSQSFFENAEFSTTQSTSPSDQTKIPLQTPTVCNNGNNTQQKCNNIIIISNKTDELMEILRLLSSINNLVTKDEPYSTDSSPSPILQSPRSPQSALPQPQSNPFTEIKSLLKSIRKTQMTPSEVIELRKSIGDLLKVLKQRRNNELSRLYLSKLNPMVGDGRDCVQAITQINEYVELLELMMVYLARDPNKLLDEMKDARFDNFESPYPHNDPQRRLIEDQFYFVHPKILNEFIDVYKKYSKDEPYFGKPTWQFSQENGPKRARSRSLGGSLNNLFHFEELIPALTYNRAPMYRPGVQYEGY